MSAQDFISIAKQSERQAYLRQCLFAKLLPPVIEALGEPFTVEVDSYDPPVLILNYYSEDKGEEIARKARALLHVAMSIRENVSAMEKQMLVTTGHFSGAKVVVRCMVVLAPTCKLEWEEVTYKRVKIVCQ